MSRERGNGIDSGRDSLRWAVEKAERLEAENTELREAGQQMSDAITYFNEQCRPDVPGTMLIGFGKLFAAQKKWNEVIATKPGEGDE